jgi:hypothetical protein
MSEEQTVVVINATIYNWQKDALRQKQEALGVYSLSEALRSVLSEIFARPDITDGKNVLPEEQPA